MYTYMYLLFLVLLLNITYSKSNIFSKYLLIYPIQVALLLILDSNVYNKILFYSYLYYQILISCMARPCFMTDVLLLKNLITSSVIIVRILSGVLLCISF